MSSHNEQTGFFGPEEALGHFSTLTAVVVDHSGAILRRFVYTAVFFF